MHDQKERPGSPRRPVSSVPVPDSQVRALQRRQSLDEQQRAFQGTYPAPHFLKLKHRPPG
jgi:hypothetical protein